MFKHKRTEDDMRIAEMRARQEEERKAAEERRKYLASQPKPADTRKEPPYDVLGSWIGTFCDLSLAARKYENDFHCKIIPNQKSFSVDESTRMVKGKISVGITGKGFSTGPDLQTRGYLKDVLKREYVELAKRAFHKALEYVK